MSDFPPNLQHDSASTPGGFGLGTMVSLRADPNRTGPIIEELSAVGERRRFKVFHSPTSIKTYYEDQLETRGPNTEVDWGHLVLQQ